MQPETMLPSRALRKALMNQYGFSAADLASAAKVSKETAQWVVRGKGKYETPNSHKIKQLFAERVGRTVEELWRDEIAQFANGRKRRTRQRVRKAS